MSATFGASDIWSYDIKSHTFTRLTFNGHSGSPIWTPDGKRIAFAQQDSTSPGIDAYWVSADGSSAPELLVGGPGGQWPSVFTPDGRTIIFDDIVRTETPMRISAATIDGTNRRAIIESQFLNRQSALSPDGHWLAYTTPETGRTEVFVRPYPLTTGKWQVSADGGSETVWSRDGRTLFYREAAASWLPRFARRRHSPSQHGAPSQRTTT